MKILDLNRMKNQQNSQLTIKNALHVKKAEQQFSNLNKNFKSVFKEKMPGLDWLPLVSQLKSTVQLIAGDVDGAAETQANFLRECPGVSQVTSVVQLATGDADGALDTQKRCLGTISNVADATPVVGHVKGKDIMHHP